jgi:NADH-quinone oxidoreductase subunit F
LKAIIPGGSSVPVFTPTEIDTPADFDSIQKAGSFLGSAAIHRRRRPRLHGAARAAGGKVLHARVVREVHAVPRGDSLDGRLLEKIESAARACGPRPAARICNRIEGRSLCALGDFAVWPVRSYIDKYRAEFEAHIDEGGCPYGGESSIEGVMAPIDQHTHSPVAEVPA